MEAEPSGEATDRAPIPPARYPSCLRMPLRRPASGSELWSLELEVADPPLFLRCRPVPSGGEELEEAVRTSVSPPPAAPTNRVGEEVVVVVVAAGACRAGRQ
jgi:hypothetical protein